MQDDAVLDRHDAKTGQRKPVDPLHIIPVDKIILRHYADIRRFDTTCADHNTARSDRIAFMDVRYGPVVEKIRIVRDCRKMLKINIEPVLLHILRMIHMIDDRAGHPGIRMGVEIVRQRAHRVFIHEHIIIQAVQILVPLL